MIVHTVVMNGIKHILSDGMKCRPGKCCQRYGDHQHQQSNGIECLWGARPVHGTLWFPIFLSLCHMTHEIAVSRWFMAKSIPSGSTKGKVKQFLARLQNFLHMKGNRPQPRVPRQDDHHRQHTIKPDDIGTRKVCLCCGQKSILSRYIGYRNTSNTKWAIHHFTLSWSVAARAQAFACA